MKKKVLIGSIGAIVILLLAGVTPVVLAQQTTKIIEKPMEVTIEEEACSICPFSDMSKEEIMDHFNGNKSTTGFIYCCLTVIQYFLDCLLTSFFPLLCFSSLVIGFGLCLLTI